MATKKPAKKKSAAKPKITQSKKLRGAGAVDEAVVAKVKSIHCEPAIVQADGATQFASITVEGHLIVDERHFVAGDVVVSGAIRIREWGALFVAGSVRAASLMTDGGELCCQTLTLEDTLFGRYESGMSTAQSASGKVWLHGNHDFEIEDTEFADDHYLGDYKPGEDQKKLPAGHGLSAECVELMIDRPQKYWEGKGPNASEDDWWKLIMSGGVSKK
jgi:hypothetical protein